MPAEPLALLAITVAGLALAVGLASTRVNQRRLLARGTVGLAGVAAIALVPTFDAALALLLALGVAQSVMAGGAPAVRVRPIAAAVAILALAAVLARVQAPDVVGRFAAVGLAGGLAAVIGVVPYVHDFDAGDAVTASPIAWSGFVGPVVASVVLLEAQRTLSVDAGGLFGGMLIGLGLLNIVWGGLASWRVGDGAAAWRYSFIADWGLALCGFGVTVADGRGGALLVLLSVVLCRLPLYLVSREALREGTLTERPINLVVAAALSGSAPFAGFAARILILRGATQLYWPLALVLGAAMLLWLPGSLRLGRSLGLPRGRQAVGVTAVIAVNAMIGLYPMPILAAAGL